jgi:thioredoxin-like negative regulator of GroEL
VTRFPVLAAGQAAEAAGAGGLVLPGFWLEACAPCRALEPRPGAFARRHRGEFTGYRAGIAAGQDTPARYRVLRIPTLVWRHHGAEVARQDGLIRDAGLEDALARLTAAPA